MRITNNTYVEEMRFFRHTKEPMSKKCDYFVIGNNALTFLETD